MIIFQAIKTGCALEGGVSARPWASASDKKQRGAVVGDVKMLLVSCPTSLGNWPGFETDDWYHGVIKFVRKKFPDGVFP